MHKITFTFLSLPLLILTACSNQENVIEGYTIQELEAIGINEGVVLTWKADENASSYVLINETNNEIRKTENTFYTFSNLENETTYKFGVASIIDNKTTNYTYIEMKPDLNNDYDPFIDELNTGLERRIDVNNMKKMFDASYINDTSTNLYRFKKVISNMKSGVEQIVAYIGGSITVGETATALDDNNHQKGYAYYSYNWLKEHYDKKQNSKFINASISGTDSSIATVRLEKDVLEQKPNLVFVEFCANNGTSIFDQKTYESLIKRLLLQENEPAVMLLFSATHYSKYTQDSYMIPIGKHYGLPMFSFVDAMTAIGVNMSTDLKDRIFHFYTNDGIHPNDQGHKLYAKVLANTLKRMVNESKEDESYVVPSSPWKEKYDAYTNLTYVNNETNANIIQSSGSFVSADTNYRVLKDTADVFAFQKGWKKTSTNDNNEMIIKVNCKNFFIIYLAGNPDIQGDPKGNMIASYQNDVDTSDKASLTWDVQKTQKQTDISTIVDNGHGWDNPCCIILLDKDVASEYTISIKMENQSDIGVLLAFGYCN